MIWPSKFQVAVFCENGGKITSGKLPTEEKEEPIINLPDTQARFQRGRGTRDQIANIHWITEKAREFQKNTYFWFTDYAKAFYCVDHNKLWEMFEELGIPEHYTSLLRNLYAGQEAIVRTKHGTTDWFQILKGVQFSSVIQLCLTLCNPIDGSPPGAPVPGILLTCLLRKCCTLVKKQ